MVANARFQTGRAAADEHGRCRLLLYRRLHEFDAEAVRRVQEGDHLAAPADARGLRIGWFADFDGYLPFEPGVIDLCEAALETFRSIGAVVEKADVAFDMVRLWLGWKTYRHFLVANRNAADHADPEKRALMKPELVWEIENGQGLSAKEVHTASMIRSDWYRHALTLFERYDFLVLPSAQVFPFDAEQHWPTRIAGRRMDTYHRWMEVVIGPTMAGLPVAAMPAGFGPHGLPTGIQMIGRPRADRAVLELAMAYEGKTDWLDARPMSSDRRRVDDQSRRPKR